MIDIGTNSTLLLIGMLNENQNIECARQSFLVTRLGERVHDTGMLSEAAMQRTIDVLKGYSKEIESYGPIPVHPVGTQALRVAGNSRDFCDRVKNELGWDVWVISGEEEAGFSFVGAMDGVQTGTDPVVVMDLGGGSTEVITGKAKKMTSHQSLPLGVVRAAEKLNMKVNLSESDGRQIMDWSKEIFAQLTRKRERDNARFIGVGGTMTTLAAIAEKMDVYDPEKINGYVMSKNDLENTYNYLNGLSLDERRKTPGLVRGREDVIVYGALIFLAFMDYMHIGQVVASDRGLRFGVLISEELQEIV